MELEFGSYEAAFAEFPEPGFHVISTLAEDAEDVLKIPVLEVEERRLICEYEILVPWLTDEAAETLVLEVLLGEFYDHAYKEDADRIEMKNRESGARRFMPYPLAGSS